MCSSLYICANFEFIKFVFFKYAKTLFSRILNTFSSFFEKNIKYVLICVIMLLLSKTFK